MPGIPALTVKTLSTGCPFVPIPMPVPTTPGMFINRSVCLFCIAIASLMCWLAILLPMAACPLCASAVFGPMNAVLPAHITKKETSVIANKISARLKKRWEEILMKYLLFLLL
jgi:hypothetical protein